MFDPYSQRARSKSPLFHSQRSHRTWNFRPERNIGDHEGFCILPVRKLRPGSSWDLSEMAELREAEPGTGTGAPPPPHPRPPQGLFAVGSRTLKFVHNMRSLAEEKL